MIDFDLWGWILAVIAALVVGVSKAGIGGLGMLSVLIFMTPRLLLASSR